MQIAYETLSRTELIDLTRELISQVEEQAFQIEKLEAELSDLRRLIFGRKSERFVPEIHPEQTTLDLGVDKPQAQPMKTETITYTRRKGQTKHTPHGRSPLPGHLPCKEIIIEPEEDTTGLTRIGQAITEELEYQPGRFVSIR